MSNEMQWTPGPWEVTDRTNGHARLIRSKSALEYSHLAGMEIGKAVVSLCGGPHECDANARLIVAAPEMAALLERLVADFGGITGGAQSTDDARALLAKIKKGA